MKHVRKYLTEALYNWMVDSNLTPMIQADVNQSGVICPSSIATDGIVTLNLNADPMDSVHFLNAVLILNCRVRGQATAIQLPWDSVLAIVARETGQGMVFALPLEATPTPPVRTKTKLTVVK